MNTVVQMVDRLRDTCESHARCNVVEVMGRHAGFIAIYTALAVGAVAVATKEFPFDEAACIESIKQAKANGKREFIVIVAEGVENYAEGLRTRIQEQTGVESKFARLAHVQRGGSPTLTDRVFAAQACERAVDELLKGNSDIVVCQHNNVIETMNIGYALKLDRMFKGKITDEEIASLTPDELAYMKARCAETLARMKEKYDLVYKIK